MGVCESVGNWRAGSSPSDTRHETRHTRHNTYQSPRHRSLLRNATNGHCVPRVTLNLYQNTKCPGASSVLRDALLAPRPGGSKPGLASDDHCSQSTRHLIHHDGVLTSTLSVPGLPPGPRLAVLSIAWLPRTFAQRPRHTACEQTPITGFVAGLGPLEITLRCN